jgi:hypothetical protein
VEKEARQPLYGTGKAEENGKPRWTPLHEELYSGIYRKDIEKRFIDFGA